MSLKNQQKLVGLPPTKFYSAPVKITLQQNIGAQELSEVLISGGYKERGFNQSLSALEFTFMTPETCFEKTQIFMSPATYTCFLIVNEKEEKILLELSTSKIINLILIVDQKPLPINFFLTPPLLISQLLNGKHILRTYTPLSQIPRYCLDAVLAIEDDRFLNHGGISIRGILRAAITNIKSGRFSQGGSTLTQQLVKNKFLTNEKTLSRKLNEAWISILLELVLTKEQILESYLNYIYWGQSGPYAVHGIQEASKLYFKKNVQELNLKECSLLSGAIKGPGIYGPHKEKSLERQTEVLARMLELNLINQSESDLNKFTKEEIVNTKNRDSIVAAHYIDAVMNAAKEKLGNDYDFQGLSLYTELDIFAQKVIESSVDKYLKGHEQGFQGTLLIGDNKLNSVIALSNGSSRLLNFNSAINAKRQIGSLAKPFVYLTAFEKIPDLTPLTEISNQPFTYKYEGQSWSPKNYSYKDKTPAYPLYQALAKSVNIPTVRLMSEFGYKDVYQNMLKFGFEKFTPVTPSLALGSFEETPLEVLKAFMNFSSSEFREEKPHFIRKISDQRNMSVYQRELNIKSVLPLPPERRITLEIMKQAFSIGTARRAKNLNLKGVYAAKTGTTNDHNDGWFMATSPDYTHISWVSKAPYLTDKGIKITGSSAAIPLWMSAIKGLESAGRYTDLDWEVDQEKLEYILVQDEDQYIDLLQRKASF